MKRSSARFTSFYVVLAAVLLAAIIFKKHQHPHHEQISVIAQSNHARGIAALHPKLTRASVQQCLSSGTASPLDCPSEQELKEFPGARVIEFAEVDGPEPGCNAVAKNGDPMDDLGHGTFCAGIIGAAGNNGKGIAGVAWKVQLMACKNINAQGDAVTSDNITCINYACDHGAKILNCSWDSRGHAFYSASERAAFQYAHDQGVIVVAAVGDDGINDDVNKDDYPTCYGFDNIVAVASTNAANELSNFSSYGATTVHLAAPGEEIISTYNASDSSYN